MWVFPDDKRGRIQRKVFLQIKTEMCIRQRVTRIASLVQCLIFREISVLEPEIALLPLAPRAFPVEVNIDALLVLFRECLGLRVSLEPCQVLDVESP